MDDNRFDAWTRRRAALGIGGLLAGALAGAAPAAVARKKKKPKGCDKKQKRRCRRDGLGCEGGKCVAVCNARNSSCGDNNVVQLCGPRFLCECSRLARGGFACAAPRPEICPGASECSNDGQCANGEVCVDASAPQCCGAQAFGVCVNEC